MSTKNNIKNKITKYEINGRTIRAGYGSCIDARIQDKEFDMYLIEVSSSLVKEWNKITLVSLTEGKIIDLLNKAIGVRILTQEDSTKVCLQIETTTHFINVFVPKGEGD